MLKYDRSPDRIEVYLEGEIDHHVSGQIRKEIEEVIADRSIRLLVLNFDRVTFMDSSGIGMVIGRYKTMKSRNGNVSARGMHPPIERIFRIAGLHRIIDITTDYRRKEA